MLPNMARALTKWEVNILVKNIQTSKNSDFENVLTVTSRNIKAVVQPDAMDELTPDTIDTSLDYICIHSKTNIFKNEYIVYNGINYIVKKRSDFSAYGYYELICEEYKTSLPEDTE